MSKAALIFCESLDGHRQTYAAVIGRVLAGMGHEVTVAYDEGLSMGRTALLDLAAERGVLKPMPYRTGSDGSPTAPLLEAERRTEAELTVIPAGDEVCPRLDMTDERLASDVRRIPIFIGFTHLYGPKSIQGPLLFRWRRWATWFVGRERFLRRTVWRNAGATKCLTTQPRCFVLPRSAKWALVPEIYRAWGFEQGESPEGALLCHKIQTFSHANLGRDILFYYGLYQRRRGLDDLLRLASEDQRYAVLFLGRWDGEAGARPAVELRAELAAQNRLLELEVPFGPESPALDTAFGCCRIMPLPYERHFNMSGTLIQASSYGIPVIVPNIGIMAETVRKRRIGWTYRHGSFQSFKDRLAEALESDLGSFTDPCREFAKCHSWDVVQREYSAALAR